MSWDFLFVRCESPLGIAKQSVLVLKVIEIVEINKSADEFWKEQMALTSCLLNCKWVSNLGKESRKRFK